MSWLFGLVFISQLLGHLEATALKDQKQDALQAIISNQVLVNANPLHNLEDANRTVPEIILHYGYPVEIHEIVTEDGYILEAHRIPYGRKCPAGEGKEVIWLQHGLLGDSSNWIITGVDNGLGYLLADACYDVWMGNARGNTYSKRHVNPDKPRAEFWSFSWHEMGIYDLPAVIDYTLGLTEASQMSYVGHSMGTTMFWICMSEKPQYNSRIKLMHALAPVAYMTNMKSPVRALAPIANDIEALLQLFGLYEFLPTSDGLAMLGAQLCVPENPFHPICSNLIFVLCGFNEDQMDLELLPVLVGHSPAGASTRSVIHYAQEVNTTYFRQFDFGLEGNRAKYGQDTPPEYELSRITAPVALYWGDNDYLANLTDVHRLSANLPNVKLDYRMKHDNFNHLDFVFAKDVKSLVNDPLMYFMQTGEEPTTTTGAPTTTPPRGNTPSGARAVLAGGFLLLATTTLLSFTV